MFSLVSSCCNFFPFFPVHVFLQILKVFPLFPISARIGDVGGRGDWTTGPHGFVSASGCNDESDAGSFRQRDADTTESATSGSGRHTHSRSPDFRLAAPTCATSRTACGTGRTTSRITCLPRGTFSPASGAE